MVTALPSWASHISALVWRLLVEPGFWASLIATLTGVFLAFELEHWRERHRSRGLYARLLNAVRYELSNLHAICEDTIAKIPQGAITSYEIDGPALQAFVSGPVLQEHAPHGLSMVLISLAVFVGAARNTLEHFRRLAGLGTPMLVARLTPLHKRIAQLKAGIENTQTLLDEEIQSLGLGVRETQRDKEVIAAFRAATPL